jgi:phospholipase C
MGYYTEQELPFYYGLFSTFAIGDRYFAPTLTRTIPNRLYLLAGTSFGHIENDLPKAAAEFSQRSIFNLLDEGGVSWKVYYSDLAVANEFAYVRNEGKSKVVPVGQYFADAQSGSLPQVAFIDPKFGGSKNAHTDEHPPSNVQVGEKFSADVINALFESRQWGSSALFLTYDEHGGYYDHVAPPEAPAPDDVAPPLGAADEAAGFDHYGIRVPVVVVSPYSRQSFVSHVVHDHTSILRFIETRFGLPSLTARDAAADPMLEFFDFGQASFAQAPVLPEAPVDLTRGECS